MLLESFPGAGISAFVMVAMQTEMQAFCAGGDVKTVVLEAMAGRWDGLSMKNFGITPVHGCGIVMSP